jgi:hypothetical protein
VSPNKEAAKGGVFKEGDRVEGDWKVYMNI